MTILESQIRTLNMPSVPTGGAVSLGAVACWTWSMRLQIERTTTIRLIGKGHLLPPQLFGLPSSQAFRHFFLISTYPRVPGKKKCVRVTDIGYYESHSSTCIHVEATLVLILSVEYLRS